MSWDQEAGGGGGRGASAPNLSPTAAPPSGAPAYSLVHLHTLKISYTAPKYHTLHQHNKCCTGILYKHKHTLYLHLVRLHKLWCTCTPSKYHILHKNIICCTCISYSRPLPGALAYLSKYFMLHCCPCHLCVLTHWWGLLGQTEWGRSRVSP